MGKIGYDTDGGGTPPKGTAEWAEQQENSAQDVGNAPKGTYAATFGEEQPSTQTATPVTSTDVENTGVGTSTDTEKPAAGATADNATTTTTDNPFQGYDNSIKQLEEARKQYEAANETPEQKAKREKRERSKRIVAAVGDGLRALSNLYFTTQYAPNMYDHEKESMMDKTTALQDKLKAEREANRDKYLNYSLKIGDLQNDKAKTMREMEAQQENMRLKREAAARDQEAHGWKAALQPDLQRKATADANAAESKATTASEEAKNAEALQKAKLETEKARGRAASASATNSYASAAAHGRSNVAEFSAFDESGREHKFRTKAAADNFARQHGTFQEEDKTETTRTTGTDRRGKQTSRTATKTTSGGGYARRPASGDNTPPSRRGNDDNTPPSRRK